MTNKISNKKYKNYDDQGTDSTVIKIENSEALDIFGVNNENLSYFEKTLPLKIFQKGNQLIVQGNKKNIDILNKAISQTINDRKINKKSGKQKQKLNDQKNIKNYITKPLNRVIGKVNCKIHQRFCKKQIIFAIGPAVLGF